MDYREIKSYTRKKPENEDYVEAEIVDDGQERTDFRAREKSGVHKNPEKVFSGIKLRIMGMMLVSGLLLTILGFVLTSTIIGAIIGIPFMILGISLLWLLIQFVFSKNKTSMFKTFRF